jgi:isoleucyl-tRNA synthetase
VEQVSCVELDEGTIGDFGIGRKLLPQSRVLGPRLGGAVQGILAAAKEGNWRIDQGVVTVGDTELLEGEYLLELTSTHADTAVQFLPEGGFVLLDTTVSEVQELEGIARDAIRWIQQQRKAEGLKVSDRIDLIVGVDQSAREALEKNEELVCEETLAVSLTLTDPDPSRESLSVGDDSQITVAVSRRDV